MLVRNGDRICLEARAKAEPAETVITADYYTQLPQIRRFTKSSHATGDHSGSNARRQ